MSDRVTVEVHSSPIRRRRLKKLIGQQPDDGFVDANFIARTASPMPAKEFGEPVRRLRGPTISKTPREVSPSQILTLKNSSFSSEYHWQPRSASREAARTPSVDLTIERELYVMTEMRDPDPNQSTRTCNAEVPLKPFLNGEFDLHNWMTVGKNQSHFINFFNPPANGSLSAGRLSWDNISFRNIEELIRACQNLGIEDTPALQQPRPQYYPPPHGSLSLDSVSPDNIEELIRACQNLGMENTPGLQQELRAFVRKHTNGSSRPLGGAGVYKLFRDSFISEDLPSTPAVIGHRPSSSATRSFISPPISPANSTPTNLPHNNPFARIPGLTNASLTSNNDPFVNSHIYQDSLVHEIIPPAKPYVPPKAQPRKLSDNHGKGRKKHIINLLVKNSKRSESTNSPTAPSRPFPKRPKQTGDDIVANILKRPRSNNGLKITPRVPLLTFASDVKSPKQTRRRKKAFPGTPKHRKEQRRHDRHVGSSSPMRTSPHKRPVRRKSRDVAKILNELHNAKPHTHESIALYDDLLSRLTGPTYE